jgi:endonuclease/exonuclease/phosphatase (EEP) superfamily protein YafD
MDAIAAAMPLVVLAGLAGASIMVIATRRAAWLTVVASVVAFGFVTIALPRAPEVGPSPVDSFRFASANISGQNSRPADGVGSVLGQHADVLVVVENEPPMRTMLENTYPYEADRAFLSVFSRYPLQRLRDGGPPLLPTELLRVRVWGPDGPFVLYAVHTRNPIYETSFGEERDFVQALVDAASEERQPVVLAGDFNMSDRSQSYRDVEAGFRDAMRVSWAGSTYERWIYAPLLLRIDHIFESPQWCAEASDTYAIAGSDHQGVASTLGPCPGHARRSAAPPGTGVSPAPSAPSTSSA